MRKFRSALAFVLAVMLVVTAIPFTAAADESTDIGGYVDFPTGWSREAMIDAVQNGLITGYGESMIAPKDLLTRAQMAAIINRAFGAEQAYPILDMYSDVSTDSWFYTDVAKAVQMRTMRGQTETVFGPNDPITREDAIVVLARALVIDAPEIAVITEYQDGNTVSDYASGAIAAFINRDYVTGYEDHTLRPKNNITREEFAQIMYNIFAAYERGNGDVTLGACDGEVILTGDNVHLYNTSIAGDLIIGDGVGATDVTLDNVTVAGRIVFRGGEGTVRLSNVSKGGLIVVNDYNGTVHFNHYSTESIFTDGVYNTPATFLDREVAGGSASGEGLKTTNDTYTEGRNDAKTGAQKEEKDEDKPNLPPVAPGISGGSPTYYKVTVDPRNGEDPTVYSVRRNYTFALSNLTLPKTPENPGFRFDGWYYMDGVNEKSFNINVVIRSDLIVYAKWVAVSSVSFLDAKDGAEMKSVTLDTGSVLPASEIPTPEKERGIFKGWYYTAEDGTETAFDTTSPVEGDLTLYPLWRAVTFADGETVYDVVDEFDPDTSIYGELPEAPAAPDGKEFGGWYYKDADGTEHEFTKDTPVSDDLTVYPKWNDVVEPGKVRVSYYVDGSEYSFEDVEVGGTVSALPDLTEAYPDRVLTGWFTESGEAFTAETQVDAALRVDAKWRTVTFAEEAGEPVYEERLEFDPDGSIKGELPEAPEAPDGKAFGGWYYKDAEGAEQEFTADTPVSDDLTVYPKWNEAIKTATVTFYVDGEPYDTKTVEVGSTVDELPTQPEDTAERTFVGWYYTDESGEHEFTTETTVSGDLSVHAKFEGVTYTVKFFVDDEEQTEHQKTVSSGETVDALPPDPAKPGFKFEYWYYLEGGEEVVFTLETAVYGNLEVHAKFSELYTVTFYEYGEELRYTVEDIAAGSTVSADEIAAAYAELEEPEKDGYQKSSAVASVYASPYTHKIAGEWYYLEDGKYVPFDESVVINGNLDVYYMFSNAILHFNLDSMFGKAGNILLSVFYDDEANVPVTALDLLWDSKNRSSLTTLLNSLLEKVRNRTISVGDLFSYMPVDEDGNINNFIYKYPLIDLLGESAIREFTADAVKDMVEGDDTMLVAAVETLVDALTGDSLGVNIKRTILEHIDEYIMDPTTALSEQMKALIRRTLDSEWDTRFPGTPKNEVALSAAVEAAFSDSEQRERFIYEALEDPEIRPTVISALEAKIRGHVSEESPFFQDIVQVAETFYDDLIEEFITSLKEEDTYLINYEKDTQKDRRFIIGAVRSKLARTTYEEIKELLPSIVFTVLEEDIVKDIYNTTMDAYKAQVEEVYNKVNEPGYKDNPVDYYVDTKVDVEVNPITQVLIPYYNKAMAKIDPQIQGSKYYETNPYVKPIEALMDYKQLVTTDGASTEAHKSGYKLRTAEEYYTLAYNAAVLVSDAGQWFVDNVPETELDDAINAFAEKVGGYYDRLAEKISFLKGDKGQKVIDYFYKLVAKVVARNNADMWNTTTDIAIDEKLGALYTKLVGAIQSKTGFDIREEIEIEISDDATDVTITQGDNVLSKSLKEFSFEFVQGSFTVTLENAIITINGGTTIDLSTYLQKITGKFGNHFTVSAIVDEEALAANNNYIEAYKLNITTESGSNYISFVAALQ